MVGRHCFDSLLSHVDKDGHELCGNEYCPLHRSIVTGASSGAPLVFAKRKDGRRTPVQVTVAPIRNAAGEIIGGVEAFRDISPALRGLGEGEGHPVRLPGAGFASGCPHPFRHALHSARRGGRRLLRDQATRRRPLRLLPGRRDGARAGRRPLHDAPQFALGPVSPAAHVARGVRREDRQRVAIGSSRAGSRLPRASAGW